MGVAVDAAQESDSTSVTEPRSEIITIIQGTDTLHFSSYYSVQHAAYSPLADTGFTPVNKVSAGQPVENGLDAVGSITRGIQVSSNSSVSLQSSMYLKIKGNLNDQYTVQGVLTDKTSPLQPIGNTRRLNDFERVMVQIDGPALQAAIGDIDLRLQHGKFGKIERSIEGLKVKAKSTRGSASGALGFSYGEYHLVQLQGKNGKQGPYRLSGKHGEKFIIILAGSEKIKLDDRLLTRGSDADYIIDYNAAEIHFTQSHILSSNSRISVEYEYVPDIYLAAYSFGKQLITGEVSLGDRKESPFFISAAWQDIRDDQKNPLGNIEAEQLEHIFGGLSAATPTAEISSIVPDSVQGSYRLDDSGVLVYLGEGLGAYRVAFSFVGLDRGTYRKVQNASDIYYVFDPLNGEYLPAQNYVAPRSLSVISLSGHARKSHLQGSFDVGVSQEKKNLYARDSQGSSRYAWDIQGGYSRPRLELHLGDKFYEAGYASHDALETLEYYRRWHVNPRLAEEEHLSYGHLRLGDQNMLKTSFSQLARSDSLVGQQITLEGQTNASAPFSAHYAANLTTLDSTLSQTHNFSTTFNRNKFTSGFHLDIEDGSASTFYASNDHFRSGVALGYKQSNRHEFMIQYDQRLDYRLSQLNQTFLTSENVKKWSDQRHDWISKYQFKDLLHSQGQLNLKYREHRSDSGSVKQYYLGNMQVSGKALNNRLRFQENYLLDEEHIPKYDYHYIEVDTGYGDYSFDPAIQDYIPITGGRFVRQRIFSDREEQVRKYENKTRLDYTSENYGKLDKIAFNSRFAYESRVKLEVQRDAVIQSQSLLNFTLDYQTGQTANFTRVSYAGRSTRNRSTLYNYGNEANSFVSHTMDANFQWDPMNQSILGLIYESRERDLDYNPLAHEYWTSLRPFVNHTLKISDHQKVEFDLKYSQVSDKEIDKTYTEIFVNSNHSLRFKKRGRLDQNVSLSRVAADVNSIPYSVFSGRQPGDNWKYSLNGRYTFSSMFQVSMNYSIQKRGSQQSEQYLRIEGRSHF